MEKEVRDFYQDGQRLLYDDDSDWEIAENERQYFYRRQELSPTWTKLRKDKEVNKYSTLDKVFGYTSNYRHWW